MFSLRERASRNESVGQRLSPEQKREITEYLQAAEAKYGFRAAAVDNIYRPSADKAPKVIFLICSDDFGNEYNKFLTEFQTDSISGKIHFLAETCRTSSNLMDWFENFRNEPDRFPIKNMQVGASLISPIIYGEKLIEEYREQAIVFFKNKSILELWQKSVLTWRRSLKRKSRARERPLFEYTRERRKQLNRYELYELYQLIIRLKKLREDNKLDLTVAIDGSGRPIGKAVEQFFDGEVPVAYICPDALRRLDLRNQDQAKSAIDTLRVEFPELFRTLAEDSRRVVFLEDQVGSERTVNQIRELIRLISSKTDDEPNMLCLSVYNGGNVPSWLRKKRVQGLKAPRVSNLTFKSEEQPTVSSTNFYRELANNVKQWKNGQPPKASPDPYEKAYPH